MTLEQMKEDAGFGPVVSKLYHDLKVEEAGGPCAKQVVLAVLRTKKGEFLGTNWCKSPQATCPRGDMPRGEGYHLCKEVCRQPYHAEEMAVANAVKAGVGLRGAVCYVYGHSQTYEKTGSGVCPNCDKLLASHGVTSAVIP